MKNQYAPLSNMTRLLELVEELQNLPTHLPRMGGFFGHTGIGKTIASAYTAAHANCVFVRAMSTSTPKWLLEQLLRDLGVAKPRGTLATLTELTAERLLDAGRPIILDEADHVVKRKFVELLRDLHDKSETPIILIGEEYLSDNLLEWERFHNRMKFVPALTPTEEDIKALRDFYHRDGVQITDDLALHFGEQVKGSIRRLAMNLHDATEFALQEGLDVIDLERWGDRGVLTGRVDHVSRMVA